MNRPSRISNVTKDYLQEFHCILEEMIEGMTSAELTDSISHNFIVQMIPHHKAAIKMCKNILRFTTNLAIQDIATGIIEEQSKSIQDMEEILCCCSEDENSPKDLERYQSGINNIMQHMFSAMENARASNEINCNFMWEMIPHHKGAVDMCETTQAYPICPELEPILNSIIVSQRRGIRQMQELLQRMQCGGNRQRGFWFM
ncbi:MAG: DUF305 domain-containing protein [Lachnospiraceae bacterium]|nr:DUF305 domain-containing protein [Lachnospiraceae bacterium]